MIKTSNTNRNIDLNFLQTLIKLLFSIITIIYFLSKLFVWFGLVEKTSSYEEKIGICKDIDNINLVCKNLWEDLKLKDEIKEVKKIKINDRNQGFLEKFFCFSSPEEKKMIKVKFKKIREIKEILKRQGIKSQNIRFYEEKKKWVKLDDKSWVLFIKNPETILHVLLNYFSKKIGTENSFILDVVVKITLCNVLYFFLSSRKQNNNIFDMSKKNDLIDIFINFSIFFCTRLIIYSSFFTDCNLPRCIEEINIISWFTFFLIPVAAISILEERKTKNSNFDENFIGAFFAVIVGIIFFYKIERKKNVIIAIHEMISSVISIILKSLKKSNKEEKVWKLL